MGRNQWEAVEGNFVSTYATDSPAEDFAESMAAFILEPNDLLKIAPEKFNFISNKFFAGKKFDRESLRAQYLKTLKLLATRDESTLRAKLNEIKRTDYYACGALSEDDEASLVRKALEVSDATSH